MDIAKDLTDIIAKNLPQAVGEQLQQRLLKADADASDVLRLKSNAESDKRDIRSLESRLAVAEAALKKHADLDAKAAAIAERERNRDISDLQVQLAAAQENAKFAQELLRGLVRNTEFRRDVWETRPQQPMAVPSGSYVDRPSTTESVSRSTTDRSE